MSKGRYSVLVNTNGEANDRIAGNREFVQNVIDQMGLPFKWSESEGDFVSIDGLHDNHLINSIKEDMVHVEDFDGMSRFLNGALMQEYAKRANIIGGE
jgi:hypothetical protein